MTRSSGHKTSGGHVGCGHGAAVAMVTVTVVTSEMPAATTVKEEDLHSQDREPLLYTSRQPPLTMGYLLSRQVEGQSKPSRVRGPPPLSPCRPTPRAPAGPRSHHGEGHEASLPQTACSSRVLLCLPLAACWKHVGTRGRGVGSKLDPDPGFLANVWKTLDSLQTPLAPVGGGYQGLLSCAAQNCNTGVAGLTSSQEGNALQS